VPKPISLPAVRITNQFRRQEALVYDLSCGEIRLTIEIARRTDDDGLGPWLVEAHVRQAAERPTIQEAGTTRDGALRSVARAWTGKRGSYAFSELDWEAVSGAMLAARAI
jgi:hypothetical protein